MNRRVTLTVADGEGRVISDQEIASAIESVMLAAKTAQGSRCDEVLTKMGTLDDMLAALEGLESEMKRLWRERLVLEKDLGILKQTQRELEDQVVAAPRLKFGRAQPGLPRHKDAPPPPRLPEVGPDPASGRSRPQLLIHGATVGN